MAAMSAPVKAAKGVDLAKQKAADKLLETIKKKARAAAKQQPAAQKQMASKQVAGAKKTIGYESNTAPQPALVSVAPKMQVPVMAKPAIKMVKPAKPR